MAIKGITGALMAGPIETPQLTPFPFEQMLAAKEFEQQRGAAAMQSNLAFMNELESMNTIPGMEDVGDYFTKSYEDEVNNIIDSFGGDMSAAAVPLQNLYFDYQRTMTDDMKAHKRASAAYSAQQAALAQGVQDGTYSSKTAAALLNQQTQEYDQSLRGYAKNEGERPTGSSFARTPIAQPDFSADFNEIIDNIKPDTYEQYGIIPVEGKPGKYTYGSSKVEYSAADARQMAAMDHIMRRDDYVDYVSEQYDLGLSGSQYDSSYGTSLDQMKSSDSLLQPLSADPEERKAQLRNAGAKDEAEYDVMSAQRNVELTDSYNKNIQSLMNSGMSREEADEILARNTWDRSQIEGGLYDIAGLARLGAYEKRTLEDISKFDKDKKKSSSSETEGITAPRTSATPSVIIDTPVTTAQSAKEKITGLEQDIALENSIINDPSQPQFRKDQAQENITNYETALQNEQETLANAQFAQAFDAIGLGEGVLDGNFKSLAEESEEFDKFVNENISKLLSHYTDEAKVIKDIPNASADDISTLIKDMSGMGIDDADWDTKFKEYEAQAKSGDLIINGLKADNLLGVARDIRGQFNRLQEVEGITRSFNQFENLGENEELRMAERTNQFISKELNILDPTQVGTDGLPVSVMDKLHTNMQTMESNLKTQQGYGQAIHAPKLTPTGDIVNGEPVFILDMAYYKPGPNQDAVPMPDDLLNTLIESDSSTARMLMNAEQQRRFAVLLPDQNQPGSQLRGFIDDKMKLAQDTDRDPKERFSAAQTAIRMELNLDYGSLIQRTGIETIPSEVFAEDQDNNTYGYVNRKIPNSLYKDIIQKDGTIKDASGNVIIDTSKGEHVRVEKVTAPNNEIYYTIYPYKGENETGRDTENRIKGEGLSTSAASLEDLIFRTFGGNDLMGQLVPDLLQ